MAATYVVDLQFETRERVIRLVYLCEKCKFIFSRAGYLERCPDCDSAAIREANEVEQKEYAKLKDEKDSLKHQK